MILAMQKDSPTGPNGTQSNAQTELASSFTMDATAGGSTTSKNTPIQTEFLDSTITGDTSSYTTSSFDENVTFDIVHHPNSVNLGTTLGDSLLCSAMREKVATASGSTTPDPLAAFIAGESLLTIEEEARREQSSPTLVAYSNTELQPVTINQSGILTANFEALYNYENGTSFSKSDGRPSSNMASLESIYFSGIDSSTSSKSTFNSEFICQTFLNTGAGNIQHVVANVSSGGTFDYKIDLLKTTAALTQVGNCGVTLIECSDSNNLPGAEFDTPSDRKVELIGNENTSIQTSVVFDGAFCAVQENGITKYLIHDLGEIVGNKGCTTITVNADYVNPVYVEGNSGNTIVSGCGNVTIDASKGGVTIDLRGEGQGGSIYGSLSPTASDTLEFDGIGYAADFGRDLINKPNSAVTANTISASAGSSTSSSWAAAAPTTQDETTSGNFGTIIAGSGGDTIACAASSDAKTVVLDGLGENVWGGGGFVTVDVQGSQSNWSVSNNWTTDRLHVQTVLTNVSGGTDTLVDASHIVFSDGTSLTITPPVPVATGWSLIGKIDGVGATAGSSQAVVDRIDGRLSPAGGATYDYAVESYIGGQIVSVSAPEWAGYTSGLGGGDALYSCAALGNNGALDITQANGAVTPGVMLSTWNMTVGDWEMMTAQNGVLSAAFSDGRPMWDVATATPNLPATPWQAAPSHMPLLSLVPSGGSGGTGSGGLGGSGGGSGSNSGAVLISGGGTISRSDAAALDTTALGDTSQTASLAHLAANPAEAVVLQAFAGGNTFVVSDANTTVCDTNADGTALSVAATLTNTIQTSVSFSLAAESAVVANLTLIDPSNGGGIVLTGDGGGDRFTDLSGAGATWSGHAGNTLIGGAGNDTFTTHQASDTVIGGRTRLASVREDACANPHHGNE